MLEEELLEKIFPELGAAKISKIMQYAQLLQDWNLRVNLVSRKDIENVLWRHIVPCLGIYKVGNFTPNDSVLDIGTGGGLPGIPLAIACPESKFTLIDSTRKKMAAVSDMVLKIGLKNVKTKNVRAEEFTGKFDKIIARAVTNMADFMKYANKLLKNRGKVLYLKGGDCSDDLKLFKKYKLYNIGDITSLKELEDKIILEIL